MELEGSHSGSRIGTILGQVNMQEVKMTVLKGNNGGRGEEVSRIHIIRHHILLSDRKQRNSTAKCIQNQINAASKLPYPEGSLTNSLLHPRYLICFELGYYCFPNRQVSSELGMKWAHPPPTRDTTLV